MSKACLPGFVWLEGLGPHAPIFYAVAPLGGSDRTENTQRNQLTRATPIVPKCWPWFPLIFCSF